MADRALVLFPFSYYDLLRRRWMRARYVASLDEIAARYGCFRIEGLPEIRSNAGAGFRPPGAGR
jgi:hypothetical protein